MSRGAMRRWRRILLAVAGVLLVNLAWHEPLERITGGGMAAELVFNVLPSAIIVALLLIAPTR